MKFSLFKALIIDNFSDASDVAPDSDGGQEVKSSDSRGRGGGRTVSAEMLLQEEATNRKSLLIC